MNPILFIKTFGVGRARVASLYNESIKTLAPLDMETIAKTIVPEASKSIVIQGFELKHYLRNGVFFYNERNYVPVFTACAMERAFRARLVRVDIRTPKPELGLIAKAVVSIERMN